MRLNSSEGEEMLIREVMLSNNIFFFENWFNEYDEISHDLSDKTNILLLI